jgi:glycosyltransferase 2 family protein
MQSEDNGRPKQRRQLSWILRCIVVGVIAWWLLSGSDLEALTSAIAKIDPASFSVAVSLVALNMLIASERWDLLMGAFGAKDTPNRLVLLRLILIGQFYNTFVPGSVGGDMVRGYVARRCFTDASSSFAVVISDRVIGLSTLGIILLGGFFWGPEIVSIQSIAPWIAGVIALGALVLIVGHFSQKLTTLWARVPRITDLRAVLKAALLSVCAHVSTICAFGALASALGLSLLWSDLCLIVPLGLIAGVIPLAIAGIGPREAALVGLLGLVNVSKPDSLALSLGFASAIIVVALLGGILQLTHGYEGVDDATSDPDTTQSSGEDLLQD